MGGYDVDVIVIYYGKRKPKEKPIDCYSKYVNEVLFSPSGDEAALITLLINQYKGSPLKPLLIPESDFSVRVVDANLQLLEKHFFVPHIGYRQGAVVEWMDKSKQKERAMFVGLNVAAAKIITIKDGRFSIPDDIQYPCFPKSIDGGKVGLGRCDNKDMLKQSLMKMAAIRDRDVLIEEYLEIDKEYALVGVSNGEKVCIPAILYNENMSKGLHYGVAQGGRVLAPTGFEELIIKFKQLIQSIHFVGLFDIDFLECKGKYYFDEINMRFGGSGHAVTMAGVSLPAIFADYMTKGRWNESVVPTGTNLVFVNEHICVDEWYGGNLSTKDLRIQLCDADVSFAKDKEDPKPYKVFRRLLFMQRYKRHIKMLVHKLKSSKKI